MVLAQNTMTAKFSNTRQLIRRIIHDTAYLRDDEQIKRVMEALNSGIEKIPFMFELQTKRPPLDPVNAVLSFVYTLFTSEFAAALETVGLDNYIRFFSNNDSCTFSNNGDWRSGSDLKHAVRFAWKIRNIAVTFRMERVSRNDRFMCFAQTLS